MHELSEFIDDAKKAVTKSREDCFNQSNIKALSAEIQSVQENIRVMSREVEQLQDAISSDMSFCNSWKTEKKQLEEKIRQSQEHLSSIRATENFSLTIQQPQRNKFPRLKKEKKNTTKSPNQIRLDEIRSSRARLENEIRNLNRDDELVDRIALLHKCRYWVSQSTLLNSEEKLKIIDTLLSHILYISPSIAHTVYYPISTTIQST